MTRAELPQGYKLEEVRQNLLLKRPNGPPEDRLVRTTLSVGHPTKNPTRGKFALPQGRKPLADLVH
jgi:hypothetical protein